jgi:hypothetical protein
MDAYSNNGCTAHVVKSDELLTVVAVRQLHLGFQSEVEVDGWQSGCDRVTPPRRLQTHSNRTVSSERECRQAG